MDEARVVINLKEGIVELQGPADFVEHCLDMCQPSIKGLQGLPQDTVERPEKARRLPEKRKAAAVIRPQRRKRASGIETLRSDLEAGFFDKPRSTEEVKRRLSDADLTLTDSGVRMNLRRLRLEGLLNTVRKGRSVRFQRRPRS